ncbi:MULTISPECIES: hypothetical protein [Cytobacillus]|jgi:hypothetical protein|uniref:Uncharacterized protein n=1 Tax=Cytobacillus pseudoceanisediminis TaxID=3051614 RepID=A0ABZ2ZPK2_9BACI|nr:MULTISPECIES: hypothetical protein [Cytobacillus]EFV75735.1 hypothetical protein HMPREF1013_04067 [Bacillus sp. 2_A_57_CT2]MBY0159575.1 hypothetical protein [Cytobacillus firmus]MBU8729012.1 hypothetical protein [Cytobacillus oceanisediminis]MBU8768914.1 hypothetical protein [Cytobacillus oceanisediminis]MCM3244848.1 hypothetical protein [Cytobacillus oceanisediminis]
MDNRDTIQPDNMDEQNQVKGSLLESMMEPMDQLSKIPPEKTDRRTSDEEMN